MPLASAMGLDGSILGSVGTKTKFWQEVATTVGRGSSEPHPSWDGKPVEMVSDSDRLDGVGATSMKQEQPPGDRRESPGFSGGEDVKVDDIDPGEVELRGLWGPLQDAYRELRPLLDAAGSLLAGLGED